ncbi:hypothetical protein E2C01_025085 [Portunus trituberculatus]|uniref:Uncharacterized protein n=1 Tax=Portunus trituberculatus TaxID=210409 RepID=A0A5B7EER8_PORTR|nr:hypothetical protein [Portunus trituberculatus]
MRSTCDNFYTLILKIQYRSLTATDEALTYICSTCYVINLLKQNIISKKARAITPHERKY